MGVEDILKGEEVSTPLGTFYKIQRHVSQTDTGKLGEYLKKHSSSLTHERMHQTYPSLEHVPFNKVMFMDIENCGFKLIESPIYLITYGNFIKERHPELEVSTLFARDFSEEKPMISYFLERLHEYQGYVTFNGKTFDLPKTSKRAQAQGIIVNGYRYRNLSDVLGPQHIDLRSKYEGSLLSNERYRLGFVRKDDVSGKDLPPIYMNYVSRRGDQHAIEKKLAQGVMHNYLDVVSVAALMLHSLVHKGKTKRSVHQN